MLGKLGFLIYIILGLAMVLIDISSEETAKSRALRWKFVLMIMLWGIAGILLMTEFKEYIF